MSDHHPNRTFPVRRLVYLALFVALYILLQNYLGIHTETLKIGFSFIPLALCAMLYGPVWTAVVAGLGDVLGFVLFPVGPYFPGFTATACLSGVLYGICLYRRPRTWPPILAAVLSNQLVVSLGANTLMIAYLYSMPLSVLLPARLIQCAILVPIQLVVLRLLKQRRLLQIIEPRSVA